MTEEEKKEREELERVKLLTDQKETIGINNVQLGTPEYILKETEQRVKSLSITLEDRRQHHE